MNTNVKLEKTSENANLRVENEPITTQRSAKHPDQNKDIEFWYTDENQNIKFNYSIEMLDFLYSYGFAKYTNPLSDETLFVRIENNVLRKVKLTEIRDFIDKHLENLPEEHYPNKHLIQRKFRNGAVNTYVTKGNLEFLPELSSEQVKDTKDKAYYFYQNGFVEITKEGYQLKSYTDLEGFVWKEQIVNRDFVKLNRYDQTADLSQLFSFSPKPDPDKNFHFFDWLVRISTPVANYADKKIERTQSLCTIIGYLLHDFHSYKKKAINLTDSTVSYNKEANGRSGKTLLSVALGYFKKGITKIDGKTFDMSNKHKFQNCNTNTQVLIINDLEQKTKHFDFSSLYTAITEQVEVERKGAQPYSIEAKILITTNQAIKGEGGSHRDRIVEYELTSFFNETLSPDKFYKYWFFSDWNNSQWNHFDNLLCRCCKDFLAYGLIEPQEISLSLRKFIESTSPEFVEFSEKYGNGLEGKEYNYNTEYEAFKKYSPDNDRVSMRTFTRYLSEFAKLNKVQIQRIGKTENKNFVFTPILV